MFLVLHCLLLLVASVLPTPALAGGPPKPPPAFQEEPVVAAQTAAPAIEKPVVPTVDLRAFGDSGYIGGVGVYGAPSKNFVKNHLKGVEILRSPDVNFLNLEGSLTRTCRDFETKPFSFAISPEALIAFGKWGFNLIGLANNHALDCQDPTPASEIAKAMAVVKKQLPKLAAHGVASSYKKLLTQLAELEIRGIKLGMVSVKAWDNGPKSTIGNIGNYTDVLQALKKADVDVRILSLHGGIESTRRPTTEVMDIARDFVARFDGDIVFAHHPHKFQGFEVIAKPNGRTAVIFYSLGNSLHNGLSVNGDGLAARVSVSKDGVDVDSLAAFPLADASHYPTPVGQAGLKLAAAILKASSTAVALRPLPPGLKRVPFVLTTVTEPALGLQLTVTPAKDEAALTRPAKGRQAKLLKSRAHAKQRKQFR